LVAWFAGLDAKIQTALIAAFVTLIGIILKDLVIGLWKDRRRDRKDALSIYRNYADPIASAASSLFWRLRETLVEEGRGAFMKSSGKITQFDQYKLSVVRLFETEGGLVLERPGASGGSF
jgi:hypothetical protein